MQIQTAPRFLTDEQFDIENKRTNVLSGDLLMTIVGTVGRVAVVPEMLAGICLQRSVAVIKPNPTIINNRYLMYQLQSMRKFLESEARGVAQKGIYLKQVGDLSVITPPLDEQYRVVDTLDHISGLIHIYQSSSSPSWTSLSKLDLSRCLATQIKIRRDGHWLVLRKLSEIKLVMVSLQKEMLIRMTAMYKSSVSLMLSTECIPTRRNCPEPMQRKLKKKNTV